MRLTRQRRAIFDLLRSLKNHPTADDIYPTLKKTIPSMSLGSLYRNLDILTREGMIAKLDTFGDTMRYDGNMEEHVHFQCVRCGAVLDFESDKDCEIRNHLRSILNSDSSIHSISIQLKGICGKCSSTSKKNKK